MVLEKFKNAYMFYCPGCDQEHLLDERWTFDGNLQTPTFSPSLLINSDSYHKRCHLFIRNGHVEFLTDCEHKLAGQTVEMVDIDAAFS